MKRFSKVLVLLFLSLFVVSTSAIAVPIVGTALQSALDRWSLDAEDDQMLMPDGWILTNASLGSNMVLYNENPLGMEFGIYSTAGHEEAIVFDGADNAVAMASVSFEAGGAVVVQLKDAGATNVGTAMYYDFTGQTIGFWISDGVKKYYSDEARNDVNDDGVYGEEADIALLAYNADPGSYVFAGDIDGNRDFANIITQAESIKPVPEPATMILFGIGLIGVAGLGRKKLL